MVGSVAWLHEAAGGDLDSTYCMEGQIYLQGRSDHTGMPVYIDGVPATSTERDAHSRRVACRRGSMR